MRCRRLGDLRDIDAIMVAGRISKEERLTCEGVGIFHLSLKRDVPPAKLVCDLVKSLLGGGKRIGRQNACADGLWPLFALEINAHPFAADLYEGVRHGASLSLAYIQSIAAGAWDPVKPNL